MAHSGPSGRVLGQPLSGRAFGAAEGAEALSPLVIGRISACLFVLCGSLVSALAFLLPLAPGADRPGLFLTGLAAAGSGLGIWIVPWNRWGRSATICLVPLALGLVSVHNWLTGYDGYLYGLFYMVIFVWIGLGHPRGWSVFCTPLLLVSYGVPLLLASGHRADALASVGYAIPACALTGETVAWVAGRLRRSEQSLRQSEERFRGLVRESADVVLLFDQEGTVTYASPALSRVLGHRPEEWVGRSPAAHLAEEDLGHLRQMWAPLVASAGASEQLDIRVKASDGSWRWCSLILRNLLDEPAIAAVVANFTDVTERVEAESLLRHHAFHDPLTDLANRALFLNRVDHALERPGRGAQQPAVILFDLDTFKTVNDSLGHSAGDAVLVEVAQRLRGSVGAGDTAARLGGDEFAVLMEAADGPVDGSLLAHRIMDSLAAPFHLNGRQMIIQASFGVAVPEGDAGTNAGELLRNADAAMYRAKWAGKSQVAVFEPGMHATALARLNLDAELRQALAQEQFVLHYQAQVGLPEGGLRGVEALVRWQHPRRGLVGPGEFIPLAEESDLIIEIGAWVLWRACEQLARWQEEGGPANLAVNLSARQISRPGFLQEVQAVLQMTGAAPSGLTLELTETVLMDDALAATRLLSGLRQLGVGLALDDFGTGYSSLSYLHQLPIDYLKIDKSFIDGIETGSRDRTLVAGIISLASGLGLTVVAEGVETAAQAGVLASMGCPMAQGFYFGRPVPPSEVTARAGLSTESAMQS